MKYEELPEPIEIGNVENLIGKKFDEITVLYRVRNQGKHIYWACICSCGEYCIKRSDNLKSDSYSFCKLPEHPSLNLIGQKRGHLTIAKRTDEYKRSNGWRYICYCDCGNPTPVIEWGKSLAYDRNQSCGCSMRRYKNEIAGQKFGYLSAIRPIAERKNNNRTIYWECKCDCGNICYIEGTRLVNGHTTSCGCRKSSIGEDNIKQILDDNKIEYEYNKSFDSCKFPDTSKFGFFDFYIQKNFLLEFDGEQHVDINQTYFGDIHYYVAVHNRDLYKNQWAWDNNIPIKRIPYTERNKLSIKRIMSDEFLITPQTHPWWFPQQNSSYPYFTIENINEIENVS